MLRGRLPGDVLSYIPYLYTYLPTWLCTYLRVPIDIASYTSRPPALHLTSSAYRRFKKKKK